MNRVIDDFDSFESQWENLSVEKKALAIEQAASLSPKTAILPVLAGLGSRRLFLKDKAKKSLEILRTKIHDTPANGDSDVAAAVCARIYNCIHGEMRPDEAGYFFTTLITSGHKGAYFAFKALCSGLIPVQTMERLMLSVPEPDRLAFVQHYVEAAPARRLKFGYAFKRILRSLHQREAVVAFFAGLFDSRKDADPFLNNIRFRLRDPDRIIKTEIRSPYPDERITGLKALSMIRGKISVDLLAGLLLDEDFRKVRIAIYNVIEASSPGDYKQLCYPILRQFHERDDQEALHAFKAMLVTGKFPPYRLLKMVRAKYPDLLPAIYRDISAWSKSAFLFVQDIALNSNEYSDRNFDANLACILGMVKKRPERIVKILGRPPAKQNAADFIEKTKTLLTREKNHIISEFDPIVHSVKRQTADLPDTAQASVKHKIERLKSGQAADFHQDVILNADLSCLSVYSLSLFFNKTVICSTRFSDSVFHNAAFRKSIFYNVDMRGARFDRVNFDGAVFINVNASGAVFKHCSFENVSVFNCDFSHADLRAANFVGAVVSKTIFKGTDFSDACFACSKMSAISLYDAVLHHTDFSDVHARFCKFQLSDNFNIRTENLDFNARRFQLTDADMPRIDMGTAAEINKQIFCEFIHYGEKKFLKQNRLSQLTALDIFNQEQTDLFRLIPFLLNDNVPMPGIRACHPKTPCGIWNYQPEPGIQKLLSRYHPNGEGLNSTDNAPMIEALFTIGSVGSIAQTMDSDIDYWVCIHENKFSPRQMDLLEEKLAGLETLAMDMFQTKVTFFIVDIFKARTNNFGDSTVESSGSAQARLLKEEFYRTMIYIAGKIPLWAVLPSAVSLNYYDCIRNNVVLPSKESRFIDLGDINAISTGEYFGGSLWQMFKSLKSPFKSVLKMALLEKFIYEYGKEKLLCNRYKDEWMNSGAHLNLARNDSYFILMESLIAYFESVGDKDSVDLLLTCFFLKLNIREDAHIEDTVFGLRRILLEKCLRQWGWTREELFRIGRFSSWDYNDVAALSNTIKEYMVTTYKTVNKRFVRQGQSRLNISPEDRTVLGRKVFIEFSKAPGRVENAFILSRNDQYYQRLHLRYTHAEGWELFNKNAAALGGSEEHLTRADTVEEIGIWLISNGLYNENHPINLVPNPSYVTFNDVQTLYKAMYDFFSPPLERYIGFDQLLIGSRVIGLFVSTNFYAPAPAKLISDYTMIYLNSWGELFYEAVVPDRPLTLQAVKKDLKIRMGQEQIPKNTWFFSAKETKRQDNPFEPDWNNPFFF